MYQGITHDKVMVVGSGWSIKRYAKPLRDLIRDKGFATLGINVMTSLCIPDYHLWTNRKQFSRMGDCIQPDKSKMLFGWKMPKQVIRQHHKGGYLSVVYSDDDNQILDINEKHIRGRFRTAGCLGIAIAHLMGAKEILVVGMDGFTLYDYKDVKNKNKNMHCYGKGHTDDADWESCVKKDRIVNLALGELSEEVDFKIITPTKFADHFDGSYLEQ